jgi:hypothetical protein
MTTGAQVFAPARSAMPLGRDVGEVHDDMGTAQDLGSGISCTASICAVSVLSLRAAMIAF